MARLTDDCFAVGERLLRVEDALSLIAGRAPAVAEAETVPPARADGRVLAEPVRAGLSLPPFDNSAVDGFAVRHADLLAGEPSILPVAARIAAGDEAPAVPPGTAARVFTGAPLPPGLDTVFMQEDATLVAPDRVRLPAGIAAGANRRLAGEDVAAGDLALEAGRRLRPADLALLGALGLPEVAVRRRLRVALMSTGDELARPGAALRPGRVYDANRPMLAGLLDRAGCEVADLGTVADRPEAVRDVLRSASDGHDLILSSGGVSVGGEDHVRAALEEAGSLAFWRVAIKPGQPVAFGTVGNAAFMGLPGNPAAAFVTFAVLGRALVAALSGEAYAAPLPIPAEADFACEKKAGRREYLRGRLAAGPGGRLRAGRHPRSGSGSVASLSGSDGLIVLPDEVTRVVPGDPVGFLPYASLA